MTESQILFCYQFLCVFFNGGGGLLEKCSWRVTLFQCSKNVALVAGKVPTVIDQFDQIFEIQKLDRVTSQTRFNQILKLYKKSFAQLGPVVII